MGLIPAPTTVTFCFPLLRLRVDITSFHTILSKSACPKDSFLSLESQGTSLPQINFDNIGIDCNIEN